MLMGLLVEPEAIATKTVAIDLNKGAPEGGGGDDEEGEYVEGNRHTLVCSGLNCRWVSSRVLIGGGLGCISSTRSFQKKIVKLGEVEQQITDNKKSWKNCPSNRLIYRHLKPKRNRLTK